MYFKKGAVGVVTVTTWSKALRTDEQIGPCSTIAALKKAYGAKLKPFKQAKRIVAYRLGNLIFTVHGPRVGVVGLGRDVAVGVRGAERADLRLALVLERGVDGVADREVLDQPGDLERAARPRGRARRGRARSRRAACAPRSARRARSSRRTRPRSGRRRRAPGARPRSRPAQRRPPARCRGRSRRPTGRRRRRLGARPRRPAGTRSPSDSSLLTGAAA